MGAERLDGLGHGCVTSCRLRRRRGPRQRAGRFVLVALRVNPFDVPATDIYGESLLSPPGGKSEENCLWFAKYCRGFDCPDCANRHIRAVHSFDLSSSDDGITFAITHFSYLRTCPTSNASGRAESAHTYVFNIGRNDATEFLACDRRHRPPRRPHREHSHESGDQHDAEPTHSRAVGSEGVNKSRKQPRRKE
jgi:hypothetical protein